MSATAPLFHTGTLLWLAVGDWAKVEPQLKALGLPIEVRSAP